MNIILLGYRGSGKTSIGKKLASQLWKTFVDIDDEICERFDGLTIAEIWDQHGEAAFREMEVKVTQEYCAKSDLVIALGGGTVMQPAARQAVVEADAIRIYLYSEPQVLLQRIKGDAATAANRPNLTQFGGGLEEIKSVLEERDPVYREVADKVFDMTELDVDNGLRHLIAKCL
jgi:shikimate kinase